LKCRNNSKKNTEKHKLCMMVHKELDKRYTLLMVDSTHLACRIITIKPPASRLSRG
jgi:hypothetical protein